MNNNPIQIGDTVWTRSMMFFVDGINPTTGEAIEAKFEARDALKVFSLPDDSSGPDNFTLLTPAGTHVWMTRDEFDTVDDPRP